MDPISPLMLFVAVALCVLLACVLTLTIMYGVDWHERARLRPGQLLELPAEDVDYEAESMLNDVLCGTRPEDL